MNIARRAESHALYRQLRAQTWRELAREVALFEHASSRARMDRVQLIRAVGVVLFESGTAEEKAEARPWLLRLLRDPVEKIRRYAIAALAKLGAGPEDEVALRSLLAAPMSEREREELSRALGKIGGPATLEGIDRLGGFAARTEQRVKVRVARTQSPSVVRMDGVLAEVAPLRIHLRGRRGLEGIIREEVESLPRTQGKFRVERVEDGLVAIRAVAPFALADLYTLRCCGSVGFLLGVVPPAGAPGESAQIASVIAAPVSRQILRTLTQGLIRYRLDFVGLGARRGLVREVASRVYALCPEILNDPQEAPWAIDIHSSARGQCVELRPKLAPDPRFAYRLDDVAAASHPPLAACLVRLAGRVEGDVVWDPFCGSSSELIERALLGGVKSLLGTDLSAEAIAISQANVAAAGLGSIPARFVRSDFREFVRGGGVRPESVGLILTNPPLGRRVRIANLRELVEDLLDVAVRVLQPGGRLVFVNPVRIDSSLSSLRLVSRRTIDLGGFDCRMERYDKLEVTETVG